MALVVPILWYAMASAGGTMAHGMFDDIIDKLQGQGVLDYLHQFFVFPLQTLAQLLPVGGVVIYAVLRRYPRSRMKDPQLRTALWIAGVNYLPYWLSPQSGIRYLMPIYGIVALMLAAWIIDTEETRRLAVKWMAAAIILKYVFALWAFPLYTERFRPHIGTIARDILMQTRGAPLYVTNAAWVGISVTADIDLAIRPHPPLVMPPSNLTNGFVISYPGEVPQGYTVASRYHGVWLLCRGTICE